MESVLSQVEANGDATVNAVVRERAEQKTVLLIAEKDVENGCIREILVIQGGDPAAHVRQFDNGEETVEKMETYR